jgi:UDP-N-acetylmuramate dehydrogenase
MDIKNKVQEDVLLAPFTTFKIGGQARYFIEVTDEDEIIGAIKFAAQQDIKIFILGGGSNILIADEGFDGLVVKIASRGILIKDEEFSSVNVTAQAGEDWDDFVKFCVNKNLAGLECLSGIPGLVGGTPIQNVGAYGQEVSETIKEVKVYDRLSRKTFKLSNARCGFEYRKSIFNTTHINQYVVLEVSYLLKKNGLPKIVYKDLINYFKDKKPNLKETRQVVKKIRESKGMLVRQGGYDSQSAGSFFKNPIISKDLFLEIKEIVKKNKLIKDDELIPFFSVDEERYKIPAAWLIEKSGFHKGFQIGPAGLSTCHTLALTNRGDAKAKDILLLKEEIQKKIKDLFAIKLVPEPNLIGFDN